MTTASSSSGIRASISEVNAFHNNPAEWWLEHVLRRKPIAEPVALLLGTIFHRAMECILKGEAREQVHEQFAAELAVAESDYRAINQDKKAESIHRQGVSLAHRILDWEMQIPVEITGTEVRLSAPVGRHTLVGTLDTTCKLGEYGGHMQHKTRTPENWEGWEDHYLRSREVDPHELAYAHLYRYNYGDGPYFGTYMNVILKSKDKRLGHFLQRIVPIQQSDVDQFLLELEKDMDAMEGWKKQQTNDNLSLVRIPEYRERALSDWGSLSPYWDVLRGRADIMDNTKFKTVEDRYGV